MYPHQNNPYGYAPPTGQPPQPQDLQQQQQQGYPGYGYPAATYGYAAPGYYAPPPQQYPPQPTYAYPGYPQVQPTYASPIAQPQLQGYAPQYGHAGYAQPQVYSYPVQPVETALPPYNPSFSEPDNRPPPFNPEQQQQAQLQQDTESPTTDATPPPSTNPELSGNDEEQTVEEVPKIHPGHYSATPATDRSFSMPALQQTQQGYAPYDPYMYNPQQYPGTMYRAHSQPNLQSPQEQPKAGGAAVKKATDKLWELSLAAGNLTGSKLGKLGKLTGRYIMGEKPIDPPKTAYDQTLFVEFGHRLGFSPHEFEQLFYHFRHLCRDFGRLQQSDILNLRSIPADLLPMFVNVFRQAGHRNGTIVDQTDIAILSQSQKLSASDLTSSPQPNISTIGFATFTAALKMLFASTPTDRLTLLFLINVTDDSVKPPIVRRDEIMSRCFRLNALMYTFGGKYNDPKQLVGTLFDFTGKSELSEEEFVSAAQLLPEDLQAQLFDFFGVFNVFEQLFWTPVAGKLKREPLSRIEKEGILAKHYKSAVHEQWEAHWCNLAEGFFWYYEENKFDAPQRVLSLSHAIVQLVADNMFQLKSGTYERKFQATSREEAEAWVTAIESHISARGKSSNRFESAYPVRFTTHDKVEPYADGRMTFHDMATAIKLAKETIFITDWFFSPEIYLTRDRSAHNGQLTDRLDYLLRDAAQRGVQVYLLVWNETKVALNLNSSYVQNVLEAAHANIKVIRHPILHPLMWSHHQKTLVIDQDIAFVGGLDLALGRFDDAEHLISDYGQPHEQTWPGKDYYNPMKAGLRDVEKPFDDLINRNESPRMAWHDIHMRMEGDSARDVAANFIQRWNHHKECVQSKHRYLTPKLTGQSTFFPSPDTALQDSSGNSPASRSSVNVSSVLATEPIPTRVQVLRSGCDWSFGFDFGSIETSIHNAYLAAIENAQHFIYIENQFFVSSTAGQPVKNRVAEALVNRLRKAITARQTFRVVVVVPSHPDGHYKDSASVRLIMKFQYKTISRGGTSILETLAREFPDVVLSDYIVFNSLRTHAFISGKPVTEQIYVHAKLMIVDDRVAIIGSANINDRSLLGERDSEIAAIVSGENSVDCTMNGAPFKVHPFAHKLRLMLWREHLGLKHDVKDPVINENFKELWYRTADRNTQIFRAVFPVVPHDNISHLCEMTEHGKQDAQSLDWLTELQGHLITYPLDFLIEESLDPTMKNPDVLLADQEIFT